jgi:hypothetical protein
MLADGSRGELAMAKRESAKKQWVRAVKTVSTFPPEGTFTKDAETIARVMASKKVSPKGIGSGIRMIQYFINRAGKNLPDERKQELERAKRILQERAQGRK